MGRDSKIQWTTSTFSPWWGCQKVSPACEHCYAESLAHRWRHEVWGPEAPRRFFGDRHWEEPIKWNREAAREPQPWRVFCGSMCDVLEDREELKPHRARLWDLIERTPNLTWLLLTKRTKHYATMTPRAWWQPGQWPRNVWAGTTVESLEWRDRRLAYLTLVPAPVRFVSAEPLLGPLELTPYLEIPGDEALFGQPIQRINWVIAGGESGPDARATKPEWARGLRDQCQAHGVPFFWKQWGEWGEDERRVGLKAAGRTLDGRTWEEVPR